MNKFETKVINTIGNDIKYPYQVAEDMRLKRKSQLIKLKDTLNKLATLRQLEAIELNGRTAVYVKTLSR